MHQFKRFVSGKGCHRRVSGRPCVVQQQRNSHWFWSSKDNWYHSYSDSHTCIKRLIHRSSTSVARRSIAMSSHRSGQPGSGVILVSDLDWTMVNHHQTPHHTDLNIFNDTWKDIVDKNPDSMLIFSSGRSPTLYKELAEEVPLLRPDVLVCSVGTEMIFLKDSTQQRVHDAWEDYLNGQGWNRDIVQQVVSAYGQDGLEIRLQQESEQRPHKISYTVHGHGNVQHLVDYITQTLKTSHDMMVNVIYSGGQDLDVLPVCASKGKALAFFLEQGQVTDIPVLVCGDSGNDVELFEVPHVHGCIVANAHKELRDWYDTCGKDNEKMFFCSKEGPAGIVECLRHFGFAA